MWDEPASNTIPYWKERPSRVTGRRSSSLSLCPPWPCQGGGAGECPRPPALYGTGAEQSRDSAWPQRGHVSRQPEDLSIPLLRAVQQRQLTQTFSWLFPPAIFFVGYIPFVSTHGPTLGQQLSHLECSLLPHGCTQLGQGLAEPRQPQSRSTQPCAAPPQSPPPHPKTVPTLFQQLGWDAKWQRRDWEEPQCLSCPVSGLGRAAGSWQQQRPRRYRSPCCAVPWEGRGSRQGFALPICPKLTSSKPVRCVAWRLVSEEASSPDHKVARLHFLCLNLEMGGKHPPSYHRDLPTDPPSPPTPKSSCSL